MAYIDQRIEAVSSATASDRASLLPKQYVMPFILVTALFFSWALAAQLNDVLIRQFQKALDLTRGQSGLIQTAFYGGCFLGGALPAGLVMRKLGYKNGILIGLCSYFIDFTKDSSPQTTERAAAHLLSFGFLALLVGRFSGAFIMQRWAAPICA